MFSQTAIYALRAMAVLKDLHPGERLPAKDLAERTRVPAHYMSKIMRRLVVAGLVEGRKGWGGGFRLSRSPSRITFAQVLAAVGSAVEGGVCAFGWERCDGENPCPLHGAWSRLQDCVRDWAERRTLA